MNILLVYYEPFVSGQTTHVFSLAKGLSIRGHRVTIVLPQKLKISAEAIRETGANLLPLEIGKFTWSQLSLRTFTSLVKTGGYDVVHVHSQEAGLVARFLAHRSGARAILYTPQTIDLRKAYLRRFYRLMENILSRITQRIISVSSSDRSRMIAWGIPAQKIVTIPNGIDASLPEKWRQAKGSETNQVVEKSNCTVMQVSRLTAQKDPLSFVRGAALVASKYPAAQFQLVGDGPLLPEVTREIASFGLGSQIHMSGFRENAYKGIGEAGLVTLTSRWEGMPYTLLEAMAWSVPVVAPSVNGCPDAIQDGETGFLVSPGDLETWSDRVVTLLKDPKLAQTMGRNGRRRVEELFTLDRMVSKIEAQYQADANSENYR